MTILRRWKRTKVARRGELVSNSPIYPMRAMPEANDRANRAIRTALENGQVLPSVLTGNPADPSNGSAGVESYAQGQQEN